MTDLTNEQRLQLAESAAGVQELAEPGSTPVVSGGPLDDALSASVLEGEPDIDIEQDTVYVTEEDDENDA